MTYALCFNCGDVKFGSLCECPSCNVSSSGDMALDMDFSDHVFAKETLKEFGAVIKAINLVCEDQTTRFWTFIYYLSKYHPSVIQIEFLPDKKRIVEEILEKTDLPDVTLRESPLKKYPNSEDYF